MRLANLTLFSPYDLPKMSLYGELVLASARDRQERGDLAGSWDDLMVMFRMARHMNGPVPLGIANKGLLIERDALGQAMRWAADPKQTPERIRAALDAFRKLPAMPPAVDTIRAEAAIAEHTLQLPEDDLATGLYALQFEQRPEPTGAGHIMAVLTTTPWEIARARRAFRLLFTAKVWQVTSEPFERQVTADWPDMVIPGQNGVPRVVPGYSLIRAQQSTPLVRLLFPNMDPFIKLSDRNEVGATGPGPDPGAAALPAQALGQAARVAPGAGHIWRARTTPRRPLLRPLLRVRQVDGPGCVAAWRPRPLLQLPEGGGVNLDGGSLAALQHRPRPAGQPGHSNRVGRNRDRRHHLPARDAGQTGGKGDQVGSGHITSPPSDGS